MPDVACTYALTTPAGTVYFNDGTADQFYIGEIPTGLAGAPISTPIDPVAYGVGSRSYNWWQRGRHIQVEGIFLIQSARRMNDILTVRNQMEETLRAALDSIGGLETDVATLTWTPLGQPSRSLTVRNDVPLECPHDQGYLVRTFNFGLFADNPVWTETPPAACTWEGLFAARSGLLEDGWEATYAYYDDLIATYPPWAANTFIMQFLRPTGFTDVFVALAGVGNLTGMSEPDWASAPSIGDNVIDGDFVWYNCGPLSGFPPIAQWATNTMYSNFISGVTSSLGDGHVYIIGIGDPIDTTGESEPTFATDGTYTTDGGGSWLDMGVIC